MAANKEVKEKKRKKYATYNEEPSLTKQSFKDQCDLPRLMRQGVPNAVGWVNTASPSFGNFADAQSFEEAQNSVAETKSAFENLPSAIRQKFKNSAANMIEFLSKAENREEAISLGLLPSEGQSQAQEDIPRPNTSQKTPVEKAVDEATEANKAEEKTS
jgi:phage internal scaffolding protein